MVDQSSSRSESRLLLFGYLKLRAASLRLMIDELVSVIDVSGQGMKIASSVPFIKGDLVLLALADQKINAEVTWSFREKDRYYSGLILQEPYHIEGWLQDQGYLFEEL